MSITNTGSASSTEVTPAVTSVHNLAVVGSPSLSVVKASTGVTDNDSSSSVTHLADVARRANVGFPFPNVPAVSIGRITSETLRATGWEPAAEADPHDIPGLIAAVEKFLDRH